MKAVPPWCTITRCSPTWSFRGLRFRVWGSSASSNPLYGNDDVFADDEDGDDDMTATAIVMAFMIIKNFQCLQAVTIGFPLIF